MPFSINLMIADKDKNVVALDWAYSNEDGTVTNQLRLAEPYGTTPFDDVTEEVALTWLAEQLPNTAEDFDAAIAERKAAVDYAASLEPYIPHNGTAPTPAPVPEPVEEEGTSAIDPEVV